MALLTREYPPDVYGGAGVHVEHLARELRRRLHLRVLCWGEPRDEPGVSAYRAWPALAEPMPEAAALQALSIDLAMVAGCQGVGLVHSHTWYANLAGHLAKLTWGVPHVATTHSLEPLRPWKAEQLGGGYHLSTFCERTGLTAADAVVAVSDGMRDDVLACYPEIDPARVHVIHNGIDATEYRPERSAETLRRYGIDPDLARPYAIFVGRMTRQKGLTHLLRAARLLDPHYPVVVCAGAADTPQVAAEVAAEAELVRSERGGLVWIEGMVPRRELIHLLSGAGVFVCPSVYEPFGLVNLEAMACQTAVVASRVGGIPEIVVEGETGYLVDWDESDPDAFARALADRLEAVLADPTAAARLGAAGRARVLERFTWPAIADQTVRLYRSLR
ncbi:MAG TPA: glycogen synthase [Candidatus Dormibacteraeota bacterium]|nr:glycogen synthase [Candidatus Dormibacteraeota bacterium]